MSSTAAHNQDGQKGEHSVRGIKPATFFFSLFVVLLLGITIGVYRHHIYSAVAPVFGIKASSESLDTTLLQQTFRELVANYDGEIDRGALLMGANRGMVAAAGDEYTAFLDAEEAAQFEDDMSGSIGGGVGAQVGVRNEQVTLLRILDDTPAQKAELLAGDIVETINDESTSGLTVDDAVAKIRGEVGTTVKLGIVRGGARHEVSITREIITSPSVTSEIKDGVGVMTIVRFDQNTVQLARQVAESFKSENVKGVVLDLRGNPGGYLTGARDIAGLWLNRQTVVIEKEGDRVVETLRSGSNTLLEGLPTVVLINGGSASASEIVAGALQDHGVAQLLGETTYGKGSVQRLVPLANGTMLKVTVARWYTPNERNITKEGVAPDVGVPMTEQQMRDGEDVQLDAALERLK